MADDASVPAGPIMISFTIGEASYQAEDGMTWADWVSSAYNTYNCTIETGAVKYGTQWIFLNTSACQSTDLIASVAYRLVTGSNPNSP